ncbi:MAG: carboxyl transferase domain-containing protein [Alphaproteobacteria bacterium]|jgi:acetyl-CoA carboxylase carboxyltransferase component|nr:acetyl-CoA carboxylase carboxyltransferase subunit [Rhodospirillaceae bacterium]MDP6021470.1 carboxyl transferase domain-containing protein [Alphaproteobacteria bacterium]MDP6256685.1 carboxyl transferase domain-containing protein [Alphaproteobacteria bacterium]MDP7056679.1 carboxyl transferase domain-containing protein [Alphaproteobacteria bacterium]MDP7230396.1 carboxyl transferase domain-containing protein [Alphaproteobacteria bacterium]|tara:strand:- start:1158 stop:2789 length:1632 start_codon:yes stop_codon:yes gene_type:complete
MPVLGSTLDTRSEAFKENRDGMLKMLAVLDELHEEVAMGGGEEAMARLRSRDKMPIRERIAMVLDQDSPFLEISPLAAWRSNFNVGSGFVVGLGVIEGTECLILGHDPSVRAGAFNQFNAKKLMRGLEIARVNRLPYVQFVESAGADLRGQGNDDPEAAIRREGGHFAESGRLFYEITELSKLRIPTISVVFGASTAGGAYQPGMSDYNIFIKNQSKVFLGGVALTKMATGEDADEESLGGADMHTRTSGLGDYLAEDELDGIRICREVVSHLNWRKKGPGPTLLIDKPLYDQEELLGLVNEDLRVPFDIRDVIARTVDGSRFEEFKPLYGPTLVTGWASVHGYPIGIVGNNGPLLSEPSEKAAQFIQLCNQIDVPILFLHNITGYIVGTDFEQGGITKNGSKMINAVANSTVPHISIIVGASYGAGNYGMSGRAYGTRFTYIWPTAKIAVMGPKQMAGVMSIVQRAAAERRGIEFDEEVDAKRAGIAEHWAEERSKGLFATSRVSDDGMIDPRDTRTVIAISLSICHNQDVAGTKEFGTWRM